MPRSAARNAAAYPPGPPPITATWRVEVFAIFFLSSLNIDHSCHPTRRKDLNVSRRWQKQVLALLRVGQRPIGPALRRISTFTFSLLPVLSKQRRHPL